MAALLRSRSVSNGPGSRLLIVTRRRTVLRARPATKPVSPDRAPFERPRMSMGAFTALEVMFLQGRDGSHGTMVRLAPQPAEEHALEQGGVEPVSFGPPMLAGDRDARRVNDMRLDAVRSK